MKTKLIILCAVFLHGAQTFLMAQKTEVAVQKGKVMVETATASVAIDEGRKTVLTPDKKPTVTVDNALVDDALKLYKLVKAEREHSDLKIDATLILVTKADIDNSLLGAVYLEIPNYGAETTNVLTLPSSLVIEDFKVYDLKGNLCRVDAKIRNDSTASYSIHFSEEVQPGGHFKLIGVADLQDIPLLPGGTSPYSKEGPLWYFRTGNMVPNCLNYFRFILPESRILVDTNREIVAMDTVDGRLAVTMRNYTGPYSDGWCIFSYLRQDKDGTSLADIPDEYHGLRSKRDKENSKTYNQEMEKILTGKRYEDQSTPLAAWLTCLGSAAQKDTELYAKSAYATITPEKAQGLIGQVGYWADKLDVLYTPKWPENPGNGYVHPLYTSRKGSLICEGMQRIVYEDGKWYVHRTKQHFGSVDKFEKPTLQEIVNAEAKGYLANWEAAGPYIQRDKKASELFDIPFGPELPDTDIPWHPVPIEVYKEHPAHVNLKKSLLYFDQAVAYLRTEIISSTEKTAHLEIYTDDGVKAWLNGNVIHENNIGRGIPEEPDIVAVTLKEGVNKLMLKVTEDILGSGAIVRVRD